MVTNKYKAIAHICIVQWGEHLTVYEVDCLGGYIVLALGCPGIWCSVALARWKKLKKEMAWM